MWKNNDKIIVNLVNKLNEYVGISMINFDLSFMPPEYQK